MITPAYVRKMAAYNRWQNQNLYGTADKLTDEQRKLPRGAFFGSIAGTLNHLLWADQLWMSRFAGTPRPKAATRLSRILNMNTARCRRLFRCVQEVADSTSTFSTLECPSRIARANSAQDWTFVARAATSSPRHRST